MFFKVKKIKIKINYILNIIFDNSYKNNSIE